MLMVIFFRISSISVPCPPLTLCGPNKDSEIIMNRKRSLKREFVHFGANPTCILKKDETINAGKLF